MDSNNQKRMVAVLKVDPYHCPKCGAGLEEDDFPVTVFSENGGMWHDAVAHYFCPVCNIDWFPSQVPDHPLYDENSNIFELEK